MKVLGVDFIENKEIQVFDLTSKWRQKAKIY